MKLVSYKQCAEKKILSSYILMPNIVHAADFYTLQNAFKMFKVFHIPLKRKRINYVDHIFFSTQYFYRTEVAAKSCSIKRYVKSNSTHSNSFRTPKNSIAHLIRKTMPAHRNHPLLHVIDLV